ncbi:MAG TPA: hypothetical protein VK674_05145 [Candidatus Limnocylindria bacterium]|nr:hypothetical protein [Candidatus Limnocylindria bacterium]
MKNATIEQILIASAPVGGDHDHPFVQKVMGSIRQERAFNQVLRESGATEKPSFITKLRHLPKLALIALAILTTLVLTGTAYAAYRLWLSPQARTGSYQENDNRKAAVIDLENCKNYGDQVTFELKRGSTLKPEEIDKVVQARCELDAIASWAGSTWKTELPASVQYSPSALTVQDISPDTISLIEEGRDQRTFALNHETIFIQSGQPATKRDIKKGDALLTVVRYHYADENGGAPTSSELLALVKVELSAHYYSWRVQNQIAERAACIGNTQETCTHGSGVDVFPRDEAMTLPYPRPTGETYEIQGEIVALEGKLFKLKGSSGKLYTVQTTEDVIGTFNENYAEAYGGLTIEIGDMLVVRYAQDPEADHQAVRSGEVLAVQLVTEITDKNNNLKKY